MNRSVHSTGFKKREKKKGASCSVAPSFLLDDFAGCESWTNGVDLYLHLIARFRLGNEDYEAFNPCHSVTTAAGFLDFNFVLLPFFDWLVEGTFIAHAFHLVRFVQLVRRQKTRTSARILTIGRSASARVHSL